ncbi:PEP-CTERM putative exosortase interaction domain-containing protein [Opitutaceae bacterium TAV1]|nr:PEP-CTERM putative exosortase interaction domain-containing protein [Opitutaceae bacterium TAV1]
MNIMTKPIQTRLAALLTAAMITLGAATTAFGDPLVTISTATIGGAGNAADDAVMANDGGTTGYGSVGYEYRIGTTEVTNAQYAAFLNAVDSSGANTLALYNSRMSSDTTYGGITWNSATSSYEVKAGFANKPVNYVNVYDAMRFTNWLTNGATAGASTETGVYTLLGGGAIPTNATVGRNVVFNGSTLTGTGDLAGITGTVWALASEDEWYKAAYYNVSTGQYSKYPNGSDSITGADANYCDDANGYTASEPKDAGSYAANPNGVYDMGGNVWEWNDSLITDFGSDISASNARGLRGGAFDCDDFYLASSGRNCDYGVYEFNYLGFRVAALSSLAAVPEPSTYAGLAGLAMLGFAALRRRGARAPRG